MSEFKIEKKVPIPPIERPNRESKYPFDELAVGESFLVENIKAPTLHSCIARYTKGPKGEGKKFTVRTVTEKQGDETIEVGVRVWRTQ